MKFALCLVPCRDGNRKGWRCNGPNPIKDASYVIILSGDCQGIECFVPNLPLILAHRLGVRPLDYLSSDTLPPQVHDEESITIVGFHYPKNLTWAPPSSRHYAFAQNFAVNLQNFLFLFKKKKIKFKGYTAPNFFYR